MSLRSAAAGRGRHLLQQGHQTMRIQTREDGLSIDQIVLSPKNYIDKAPGAATIVAR
jgi:hypothetical protein